jgi:ABC-type multidrug transport system fused ATPase/permease subunit
VIRSYRQIWDLLTQRERLRFVILILMTMLMSVFELVGVAGILPFLTVLSRPDLIDTHWALQGFARVLGLSDHKSVQIALGLAIFAVMALGMVVRAAVTYAQIRFALARSHSLAVRLLRGYLAHDYVWYLSRNTASLSQSLLSEVDQVVKESILPAVLLISNATILVLIGGFLFLVKPMVALGATGLLVGVYLLAYLLLRRRLAHVGRQRVANNKQRFRVVQEVSGGLKEIKMMGLEQTSLNRFRAPAEAMARYQTAGLVIARLPRFALEAVVYGGFIAMVLGIIVIRGEDIADLLPLLGLLGMSATKMFPALQQLYQEISAMRFSAAGLARLHADMREAATDLPPSGATTAPLHLTRALEFRDVRFAYPAAEQPTLAGLDLAIAARSTVGIVGGTGAGKTTVIDMILGLLAPEAGEILVDGTPVTRENRRAWQQSLGYVPQAIFLTDDTVAANIAFGLPPGEIDRTRVEAAARIANLHEFVTTELPQGYDTLVGERGIRLSGGQRQRIGIARALYRDPDVLVLDEATSALDNLTERAVMEAVHNLGGRKTVILVAHRLTTVKDCDKIIVLERGRVVGEGSYAELVAGNDAFRRMAGE